MRRTWLKAIIVLSCIILTAGCQSLPKEAEPDTIYQYATLESLLAGVYDGQLRFGELSGYGDTGLGTLEHLDGEMIALDGLFYQIDSAGTVRQIGEEETTPFAVVTPFSPDITVVSDEAMDLKELGSFLDETIPSKNLPYCIRISGSFSYVKTRSVPAQKAPYPRLLEVLKTQPTFEFSGIEGDIIAFRLPSYMAGANAAGYHYHFISSDRTAGGHLLEVRTKEVSCALDRSDSWVVNLPLEGSFLTYEANSDTYR